jgi:hypothetical protein
VRISNATFRFKSLSWYKKTLLRRQSAPIPNTFGVFPWSESTLLADGVVKMKIPLMTWRGHKKFQSEIWSKFRLTRCLCTEQFLISTTKINGPICDTVWFLVTSSIYPICAKVSKSVSESVSERVSQPVNQSISPSVSQSASA